jgi:hypothetical protein
MAFLPARVGFSRQAGLKSPANRQPGKAALQRLQICYRVIVRVQTYNDPACWSEALTKHEVEKVAA